MYFFKNGALLFYNSIKYKTLYVSGIPFSEEAHVEFIAPEHGVLRISYTTDYAIILNFINIAYDLASEFLGAERGGKDVYPVGGRQLQAFFSSLINGQLSRFMDQMRKIALNEAGAPENFVKSQLESNAYDLIKALVEAILAGDKRFNSTKLLGKVAFWIEKGEQLMTVVKSASQSATLYNMLKFPEKMTIYIDYSGEKGQRGYYGGINEHERELEPFLGNHAVDYYSPIYADTLRDEWWIPFILTVKTLPSGQGQRSVALPSDQQFQG